MNARLEIPSMVKGSSFSRPKALQLRTGLQTQVRVLKALMLREALGQHGHHGLGFFWIIGEPLLLMCGIIILWSLAHITHGGEVDVIPFALSGYSFLTLWRHIVFRSARAMRQSTHLLYFRRVKLLDVLVARATLESLAIISAFFVSYIPLWLLGLCPTMTDPLLVVMGFVFTAWFAFAFGLVIAGLSESSEVVHHFIQPAMYITMPLTGAFSLMDWLPARTQEFLGYSPLVNCIELLRNGMFSADVITHWSLWYLIVCCSLTTAVGIQLVIFAEKHFIND